MKKLLDVIAYVGVALFVVVWGWVLSLTYKAGDPGAVIPTALMTTAGYLTSTVGAATAAVLGLSVAKGGGGQQPPPNGPPSLAAKIAQGTTDSTVVLVSVVAYLATGLAVLITWLIKDTIAPDLVKSFALGVLGWLGGAVTAALKATP